MFRCTYHNYTGYERDFIVHIYMNGGHTDSSTNETVGGRGEEALIFFFGVLIPGANFTTLLNSNHISVLTVTDKVA